VLRIFGPKRDDVKREWSKPHNEELNDLYSSPSIFRVIKSRIMRWAGHVARMGRGGRMQGFGGGTWGHLGVPGIGGRIILRWIFSKLNVAIWTGSTWLRIRTGGGHL